MVLDDYFYDRNARTIANYGHCRELPPDEIRFDFYDKDTIHFQLPVDYRPEKLFIDSTLSQMFLLLSDSRNSIVPEDNEEDYFSLYGCKNYNKLEKNKIGSMDYMKVNSFKYKRSQRDDMSWAIYLARISFTDEDGKDAKIVCMERKIHANVYTLQKGKNKRRLFSMIDKYFNGMNVG